MSLDRRAAVPTVYEKSVAGREGVRPPAPDVPRTEIPAELVRADNGLPELSQGDVARHYLHLSQRNFGVDSGFYPLGSCTMKFNPRLGETASRLPGFADSHPLARAEDVQGNLALMWRLQAWLAEIGGFEAVSLQPAAGAHGELTALLMMRAYHADRGDVGRDQVLIPDSAHGTNPASTTMAGLEVVEIPSDARGNVDLSALRAACDARVAGLMLTNPNTLGLFEEHLAEIVAAVHACGGLVYGDGANMNALTGIARPGIAGAGALGIDLMHYNLHKTFGAPHGGGGPGSGPVAASAALAPYLPGPVVALDEGRFRFATPERSIGRMASFHGNFAVLVRAYAYIREHGAEGLRANAMHAVLNANYLRALIGRDYPLSHDRRCMHEFVCQGRPKGGRPKGGRPEGSQVRALDVSKRLIDHGYHPPTNYFPLIVPEALMIEPTESESKETLDAFAAAMAEIAEEARRDPDLLRAAPHIAPVGRLDEVKAAQDLILTDPAATTGREQIE